MSIHQPLKRVVITGIGLVTPIGVGVPTAWDALISGARAGNSLEGVPGFEQIPSKVCCRVPEGKEKGMLDLSIFKAADLRTMSRSTTFAIVAADEAMRDAGLAGQDGMLDSSYDSTRFGVAVGSSIMDVNDIHSAGMLLDSGQYRKISPYFIPRVLTSMPGGILSMRYGLRGPNHSVATACATGSMSVGDAATMIRLGRADAMLCGATDACISPIVMAGFGRLKALSTAFNEDPKAASRPFDGKRDGFVMGEGAGIMVLETLEHARSRRSPVIYGEILGYGLSGDASHMTSPDASGRGARASMQNALKDASLDIYSVGYINAHATSTPVGDQIEVDAIAGLYSPAETSGGGSGNIQKTICISSTKGSTGHVQGAAGAVETIFSILAAKTGIIPPTGNLTDCDFAENKYSHMHFVTGGEPVSWPIDDCDPEANRVAMSNSFGFGGINATVVVGSFR